MPNTKLNTGELYVGKKVKKVVKSVTKGIGSILGGGPDTKDLRKAQEAEAKRQAQLAQDSTADLSLGFTTDVRSGADLDEIPAARRRRQGGISTGLGL